MRYEDYKARVELLCRALELLSVADDGVFYDSAGDDESDWPPWTVRRVIESGPGSRYMVFKKSLRRRECGSHNRSSDCRT